MSSPGEIFELFLDYVDAFARWIARRFCPWIGVPAFIAACLALVFLAPSCKKLLLVSTNSSILPPKTGFVSSALTIGFNDWEGWSPWLMCATSECGVLTHRHRTCAYGYTCSGFKDEQNSCNIESCRKGIDLY